MSNFNYILIAIALGGVFNIPSLKSYAIAMIAVATSTLVASAGQVFWSQYGLPIFTLPFLLITLSFVYILNLLDFELRTKFYIGTPEQNLEHYCTNQGRFITDQVAISLPFKDRWLAWQGFDGKWTHKGEYRYAYDFVKTDSSGRTNSGSGNLLTDKYTSVLISINGILSISKLNKLRNTLELAAVMIKVKQPAMIISGRLNNESLNKKPIAKPTNKALYV